MNFEFSDEQNLLREQAQSFLTDKCPLTAVRRVLDGDQPNDAQLWRGMIDLGWTATAIPEEFGGIGLGYLELCVLAEELGRSLAPTPFSSSVYLATEAILAFGTAKQKARYLPKLAAGEWIGTFAIAEGAGEPARSLKTKAKKGAIKGTKVPVPGRRRGGLRDRAREGRQETRVDVHRRPQRRWRETRGRADARPDPFARVDPLQRRRRRTARQGRQGLDTNRETVRPRRRAVFVRAGRRRSSGAEHGEAIRARSVRVRPADRVVPGDQTQARRHVHRQHPRPLELLLRRVGAVDRRRRSCRSPLQRHA